jgi:hypothetical protein
MNDTLKSIQLAIESAFTGMFVPKMNKIHISHILLREINNEAYCNHLIISKLIILEVADWEYIIKINQDIELKILLHKEIING